MIYRLVIAALFVVLTPAAALACPVCGLAGPGNNGWAYFAMTIMMSVVPLAFIGGVVFWVYRRATAEDRRADTRSAPTRPML